MDAFPRAVAVSALRGIGIEALLDAVGEQLYERYVPVEVRLPYEEGALIAMFHELGQVEQVEHDRRGVFIRGRLPGRLLARYAPFEEN